MHALHEEHYIKSTWEYVGVRLQSSMLEEADVS